MHDGGIEFSVFVTANPSCATVKYWETHFDQTAANCCSSPSMTIIFCLVFYNGSPTLVTTSSTKGADSVLSNITPQETSQQRTIIKKRSFISLQFY